VLVLGVVTGVALGGIGGFVARVFITTVLAGVIGAAYEVTMLATKGQTLGKMALGIRVVRPDAPVLGGAVAVKRWATTFLVQLVPAVGWVLALACYLSAAVDPQRRGVHDKVAGTWVVATPRTP
jgi:uncharacterized RDD family membrane protein YckC